MRVGALSEAFKRVKQGYGLLYSPSSTFCECSAPLVFLDQQ